MKRITMTRQAFPAGGGAVLAANRTYELADDVVARLPKGSYRSAESAKTKPARPPKTK